MTRPQDIVPEPQTIGEHIQYERVGRGMRQKDLALATNAGVWTVITWERHGVEPSAKFIPAIIEWLGFDPFPTGETFGERLAWKRKKAGLRRHALAKRLGVSYCTVEQWEHDACRPCDDNITRVHLVFGHID